MDKFYRNAIFLGDSHFEKNMFFRGSQVFGAYGKIFFVDKKNGLDTNSGLSWDEAVKTIAKAIALSNASIDWGGDPWLVDNYIIIAPGLYKENLESVPHSCHVIGLGVPGTDTAVEIHPDTGKAIDVETAVGVHFYNIRFECHGAINLIEFGICNNVIFEDCEFNPASASVKAAISTENSAYLTVKNCKFTSGSHLFTFDYGIYTSVNGNFFHNALIENNIFDGIKATGTAILIKNQCTSSKTVIKNNIIRLTGAGVGIDDNNDNAIVVGNKIFHVGGTPLDVNAKLASMNILNDNGAVTCSPTINFGAQSA